MRRRHFAISILAFLLTLSLLNPVSYGQGLKQAAASLVVPTTGQAMNGELGKTKTKLMGGLEFGLVTATAVLGVATGGGAVWFAAGPLIANHLWSSVDAYRGAKNKVQPMPQLYMQGGMNETQQILEYSRQRRMGQEPMYSSDIRDRIQRANYN